MDFVDELKGWGAPAKAKEKRAYAREHFQVHSYLCFIREFDESLKY
jgi:hypothetical protein